MQGFIEGAFKTFMSVTGASKFWALLGDKWDWNRAYGIALILALILFIIGCIRLLPKPSATMGKTFGGVAIGLIKLAIGMGLALGIANMILHMGMSMISGALGRIPLIGTFLANVANWLISAVAGLIIAIMMGWYLIKNVGSIFGQAMGVVQSSVSAWQADKDDGGVNGVKTSYVVAVLLIIGAGICHPNWNAKSYYAGVIFSAGFGIFALIWTTAVGKKAIDRTVGTVLHKPRESDGAWKCPNHSGKDAKGKPGKGKSNPMPILNKDGTPKRGANDKLMRGVGFCAGPQGKNDKGVAYDGWNPKDAEHCLSLICDHPNPYWIVCPNCKATKKGYKKIHPRDPQKPWRCPDCRKTQPPVPETTPFHVPGKDKDSPKQLKAGPKKPQLPGAQAVRLLPAPGQGTKFCTNCGQGLPLKACVCPFCGTPVPPPAAPTPPVAPAPPAAPASTAAVAPAPPTAPKQFRRRPGHRSLKDKWR